MIRFHLNGSCSSGGLAAPMFRVAYSPSMKLPARSNILPVTM